MRVPSGTQCARDGVLEKLVSLVKDQPLPKPSPPTHASADCDLFLSIVQEIQVLSKSLVRQARQAQHVPVLAHGVEVASATLANAFDRAASEPERPNATEMEERLTDKKFQGDRYN